MEKNPPLLNLRRPADRLAPPQAPVVSQVPQVTATRTPKRPLLPIPKTAAAPTAAQDISAILASFRDRRAPIGWVTNPHHDRPLGVAPWLTAAGIAGVGVLVFLFQKNITFAILLIIAAGMVAYRAHVHGEPEHILLDERGVTLRDVFYPYSRITSFWLDETGFQPELCLHIKRWHNHREWIPVPHHLAEPVRNLLMLSVSEEESELTFADMLGRRLGI